jgi:hypothetical protein
MNFGSPLVVAGDGACTGGDTTPEWRIADTSPFGIGTIESERGLMCASQIIWEDVRDSSALYGKAMGFPAPPDTPVVTGVFETVDASDDGSSGGGEYEYGLEAYTNPQLLVVAGNPSHWLYRRSDDPSKLWCRFLPLSCSLSTRYPFGPDFTVSSGVSHRNLPNQSWASLGEWLGWQQRQTTSAGYLTIKIDGFPDVEMPLFWITTTSLLRFDDEPHVLSSSSMDGTANATIQAVEYFTYGGIYDEDTGAAV